MSDNSRPLSSDRLAALRTDIAARREELIALTQDLVRIPTLNPPGADYRRCCEYLGARLAAHGFDVRFIRAEGAPGDTDAYPRWNVVARHEGRQAGACVHFNSHIDVVEVGAGWTKDPFGGTVEDGKVYGRGACDMKGGLAASIIAAESFIRLFPDYSGAIEISGTADEETGGYGGVAYLAQNGWFAPKRVQHVIIPEPLQKDRICLGHRGGWWAEIETFGEIAHGSMPFLGDCAVRHMGAVLHKFETELLPAISERQTKMPVAPDGARRSTMNINAVHGGQEELAKGSTALLSNCVPDSCRLSIERRYLVEESYEGVRGEIAAMLDSLKATRPRFDYALRELNHVAPSMTQPDAPIVQTLARQIEAVLGDAPELIASPGSYDQKHIDRIGKLQNCVAYGPGLLELAHKPDEYVDVNDMLDSAIVMAAALAELLLQQSD
ncbi:MAG: acetylornithine deacetylase/succinyl-diaminopimelate desuccinylase family protein [Neomegalonema sp.]|nr:acetylornithine deacetylase/succinyl-diaminopimelate desuccinylase family protein [Neomegalonema sp.]